MRTTESYREVLSQGRWFGALAKEHQDFLIHRGVLREYAPGQALFRSGDRADGLYGVLEGGVQMTSTPVPGREVILARAESPSWLGEVFVFDGLPRSHNALAEGVTTAIHVPDNYVTAFVREDPSFALALGALLSTKFRLALIVIEEAAALSTRGRLARRILMMAEAYGHLDEAQPRPLAIRQDELASMLAVSRPTMNQALRDLESTGSVKLVYGGLEILDIPTLRREAVMGTSMPPPPPTYEK